MRKPIIFLLSLAILCSFAIPAYASSDISVSVDGRKILFRNDPKPVVIQDRTYVPIRRVLEHMGAKVSWDGDKRTVTVDSFDNITKVILTIDSTEIKVYTFTSVFAAEEEIVTSDVPPIILNDRTMLPIRVIAEALGADVSYDEETYSANIVTKQAKRIATRVYEADTSAEDFSIADTVSENIPKFSIYSDAENVKEGDTVSVYLKVTDIDKYSEEATVSGIVTTLFYDSTSFSYDGFECLSVDGDIEPSLYAHNPTFYDGAVKIVYIFAPESHDPLEDGTALKIKFTALKDGGGSFALSNGISEIGYDNELLLSDGDDSVSLHKYDDLYVDTTEITVE